MLLGRYPAAKIEAAPAFPALPPPVAVGVPASLLERRPDLAAAEHQLLAAFRRQEAAKLALLPDISIGFVGGWRDLERRMSEAFTKQRTETPNRRGELR